MQYYLASKLGESSSNGTRVFAIAKAEELKFDSRPSNEQLPTLRKDIKAYADVRSQAAAESEGSKPRKVKKNLCTALKIFYRCSL